MLEVFSSKASKNRYDRLNKPGLQPLAVFPTTTNKGISVKGARHSSYEKFASFDSVAGNSDSKLSMLKPSPYF